LEKNDMNILLFLATEKGEKYLEKFIEYDKQKIKGVFSFEEKNVVENYYNNIKELSQNNEINFYEWFKNKNNLEKIVIDNEITHIIIIGWRYIINEKINEYLDEKMIVYHDSLLPKYRGFSPTPTAIINGEKEFGFSVIFAEKEMDTGDIILQKKYELKDEYTIKDCIKILSEGYSNSIPSVIKNLKNKKYIKQNEEKATYSCWRDLEDMQIDWKKSNKEIYNFIRALGEPYKGAYTYYNNKKIIIKESEIIKNNITFEINYPGKFWKINNDEATIICGKGLLRVKECYYENGEKVYFKKLREKFYFMGEI